VVCVAAGNDGADNAGSGTVALGSVGAPATAKNCIAVGASENERPGFSGNGGQALTYGIGWPSNFPVDPLASDQVADRRDGMVGFSSRGPAANNRIRPDVVAPGTAVLSTKSRASTDTGWGPSTDPDYFYDGGTSMATPLVAGCAAVVRQCLIADGVSCPSAALVKAMLINGATPIAGQYTPSEVGGPPDNNQGFGRVNLASTVGPRDAGCTVTYCDEATALVTGQSEQQTVTVVSGAVIKVTLVWTDLAGEALQNDLDLNVTTPDGQEHHGNMADGVTDFDRTSNAEQVWTTAACDGDVQIVVSSYRSVQPQSYALVVRVTNP
jgi:serine protease AprX